MPEAFYYRPMPALFAVKAFFAIIIFFAVKKIFAVKIARKARPEIIGSRGSNILFLEQAAFIAIEQPGRKGNGNVAAVSFIRSVRRMERS